MYVHKSCTVFYVKILVHEFIFNYQSIKIHNLKTFWYVSNLIFVFKASTAALSGNLF